MSTGNLVTQKIWLWPTEATPESRCVHAELIYDADDPWVVTLARPGIRADVADVTWAFDRGLLVDGMAASVRAGGFGVSPTLDDGRTSGLIISLPTADGPLSWWTPASRVDTFLLLTYLRVPMGGERERYDLDAELRALVGERGVV